TSRTPRPTAGVRSQHRSSPASCSTHWPSSTCPRRARRRDRAAGAPRYPERRSVIEGKRSARVQLRELLDGVEVLALHGDPTVEIAQLTHDSRRVKPGACFACIPGGTTDGHAHAPAAVAAGAVALLLERPLDLGVSEARVANVRRVLGPVAARFHDFPSRTMRCLGVTGTNGKTTTTYLLEAIGRAAGERVGLVGTTGAHVDGA